MNRKFCFYFLISSFAIQGFCVEDAKNSTKARSGRTDDNALYVSQDTYALKKDSPVVYTPEDAYAEDDLNSFQAAEPRTSFTKSEFSPPSSFDQYTSKDFVKPSQAKYNSQKRLYKSGTHVNWNVWKGEMPTMPAPPPMPPAMPMPEKKPEPYPEIEEYYWPAGNWKGDAWSPQEMKMMMSMMQGMNMPKKGLLSKLKEDPMALLLACVIPISLLLAAVLPTLMNMMMNGGIPTITTTATGNSGRNLKEAEFLSPVVQAISTFGARALDNPECMQRIFCQVTKGSADNHTDTTALQKTLYGLSKFVDQKYLEQFGVKTLFESMSNGDCEKIPCEAFNSKPEENNKLKGKM